MSAHPSHESDTRNGQVNEDYSQGIVEACSIGLGHVSSKIVWAETTRQKLSEWHLRCDGMFIGQDDDQVRGELIHHLATDATRCPAIRGRNGNGSEFLVTFGNGFSYCYLLSANRGRISGILNVATSEDSTVLG